MWFRKNNTWIRYSSKDVPRLDSHTYLSISRYTNVCRYLGALVIWCSLESYLLTVFSNNCLLLPTNRARNYQNLSTQLKNKQMSQMSQIFFDCGCERTWPHGFAEARKHMTLKMLNAISVFFWKILRHPASLFAVPSSCSWLQWFCYGSHALALTKFPPAKKRETNEHRDRQYFENYCTTTASALLFRYRYIPMPSSQGFSQLISYQLLA